MIKWLVVLLVVALVIPSLGGCSKEEEAEVSEPGVVPTGTLTIGLKDMGMMQYQAWKGTASALRSVINCMADYLTYAKHDTHELIPGLATRWEVSEDGKSCHFWLKEGVQFHDGWGELTSEDVKYTIELSLDPDISTANWSETFGKDIVEIETPSRYEVIIHFDKPSGPYAPHWFSGCKREAIPIGCKAHIEQVGPDEALRKPIFTGPYKFVEDAIGEYAKLEALESHWRVVPEYKYLIFKEVPEETTMLAMFKRGDLDIAEVMAETASQLQAQGVGTVVPATGTSPMNLSLWGQYDPETSFYDPDVPWLKKEVREAMNLAIDKQAIADAIFAGFAVPFGTPFHWPWSDEFEPYPYDPDRAELLLEQAGYPHGFPVELMHMPYPGQMPEMMEVLQAVAGYWEAIGLDTKITMGEMPGSFLKARFRQLPGIVGSWTSSTPFEPWDQIFYNQFYSKTNNMPYYESPELDALVEQTVALTSPEERDEMAKQMTQYIYDEYACVPLVLADKLWVKGEHVGTWFPTQDNWMIPLIEYAQHPTPLNTFRLFEP